MQPDINVAILENHQGTIDGYTYRLNMIPGINIKATCTFAEEIENVLAKDHVDLLISGIDIRVSKNNWNPFPILYYIGRIREQKPEIKLLVISYIHQQPLVRSLFEAGVNGFILKEDQKSIQNLGKIVEVIASGGVFYSEEIHQSLYTNSPSINFTKRQYEALSLCASFPDEDTFSLAKRLNISGSTFRNILSAIYGKLGVRTRAAAIFKARQMGVIPLLSMSEEYHSTNKIE